MKKSGTVQPRCSRSPVRYASATGLLVLLGACGGGGASGSCSDVVDGFASAWERCGRLTYDEARDLFASSFACGAAKGADGAAVKECLAELDVLPCSAVENGVTPKSCQGAIATE